MELSQKNVFTMLMKSISRLTRMTVRNLVIIGDGYVKFAGVVSGNNGMTMMVMMGGCSDAQLSILMLVFQKNSRRFPIRGNPDNVPGLCYRS